MPMDTLREETVDIQTNHMVISIEQLRPNDYNPNRMEPSEFTEFVTEVRHLGRLPKPVVVRPDGPHVYMIVDGEHGWRAAQEVGLTEIPCEVIDADDFEAMRQTYKRNQHGTHNPVLLGRMFRRMMETRGLSLRALAGEISVSEGTIRNALLYAQAADVRNSYAFEQLSVRQVRTYLTLAESIRDIWLDAGADLKALNESLQVRWTVDGKEQAFYWELHDLHCIVDAGLLDTLEATHRGFVPSMRRALQLWLWRDKYRRYIEDIDAYIKPVATLRLSVDVLNQLPCTADTGRMRILVTVDQWASILENCSARASDRADFEAMFDASVRMTLRQNGESIEDVSDPRIVEFLEIVQRAPDFIQESGLQLMDKVRLALATADVPEDILLEAKREACSLLRSRDGWLTGSKAIADRLDPGKLQQIQQSWATLTVQEALNNALQTQLRERSLKERNALFADHDRLVQAVMVKLKKQYMMREQTIQDRPAWQVFEDQLTGLNPAMVKFLAAYILGHAEAATGFWFNAMNRDP
jgi:ParB/RepB/Spo0J family partition protein